MSTRTIWPNLGHAAPERSLVAWTEPVHHTKHSHLQDPGLKSRAQGPVQGFLGGLLVGIPTCTTIQQALQERRAFELPQGHVGRKVCLGLSLRQCSGMPHRVQRALPLGDLALQRGPQSQSGPQGSWASWGGRLAGNLGLTPATLRNSFTVKFRR